MAKKTMRLMTERNIIALLFVLSTFFFLYQHYVNISWDFSAYVSNARYWAGAGAYYEHVRPPLMPFIVAGLSVFGWTAAEYIFIILVSVLFLYSTIKLADAVRINRTLFYSLSLSPYVMFYGTINGTELLSLALLGIFIAAVIERKDYAGFFLGLAFLARYNMSLFLPLVLSSNYRTTARNMAAFAVPVAAWLFFNLYWTGNMFTSVADAYASMFKYRTMAQSFSFDHIFAVLMFLLPAFIIGVHAALAKVKSSARNIRWLLVKERVSVIMAAVVLMTLFQYYVNPVKDVRYVFALVMPVTYFSAAGFSRIRTWSQFVFILALAATVAIGAIYVYDEFSNKGVEPRYKYEYAVVKSSELGITDCRTMSNAWPLMNYVGKVTEPSPDPRILANRIDEGYVMLMFRSVEEPEWVRNYTFVHSLPLIHENDQFFVISSGVCLPARYVNSTYVERLEQTVKIKYNLTINTNPCFTLFSGIGLAEKSCNFFNFNGFSRDENRFDALNMTAI